MHHTNGSTIETFPLTVNSQRLIRQIPALFVSSTDAVAETIQNAWRAGATQLAVHVRSADRTIQFIDNGPGLIDREHLFSVASSGWDTDRVIDAAGIGALALFSLAEFVRVESVPPAPHPAWSAEFGADLFDGGLVRYQPEHRGDRPCGLTITARLKPDVVFPRLTASQWRHQFPLTVTVHMDDAPPYVVPPVTIAGVAIETPVGVVIVADSRHAWSAEAVWEHRLLNGDSRCVNSLVDRALSDSLAGAVVKQLLVHHSLTWYIAPTSGVRPKLPDRRELIENAALRDAARIIATALEDEIDTTALRQEAHALVRGPVIDQSVAATDLSPESCGRLGALGRIALSVVLPYIGYIRRDVPVPPEDVEWAIQGDGDDLEFKREAATTKVWVIPHYRAASSAVEAAALAIDVPAVVDADPSLPLVRFACDSWTASPALVSLFAQGLRIVVDPAQAIPNEEPTVLGRVTHIIVLDADMFGDASAGFAPEVEAAIQHVFSSAGATSRQWETNNLSVLYPVHTADLVEYILGDPGFEAQLMFTCYDHSQPFDMWEYMEWVDRTVDTRMLVRDAADLFATEQGGDLAQRVLRESQAYRLHRAVRESLSEMKSRLHARVFEAAREVALAPSTVDRIEQAIAQCATELGAVTVETLLAR